MHRLAELIANGQGEVPFDLSGADRQNLCEEVRRRRRDRLILHLARVLALNLRRGPCP